MSSLLNKLSTITEDCGSLYITCHTISNKTPIDQPEIKKVNSNFYSAKIILVRDNKVYDLTEWFSLPRENINSILDELPNGDLTIILDNVPDTNDLFKNTNAVFTLSENMSNETMKWLDDL